MYLLDTNTCIFFLKDKYPSLSEKIMSRDPSEFSVSSVTVFELEYGAAKSQWGDKTRLRLAIFLSPFTVIPFDTSDAVVAGRIKGELAKNGKIIGPYDLKIAAQGLARGLTVITNNTNEFRRVPGLNVEDWTK
ncbi:MAG: type II toxin-antitoxin system VapC family toxin [Clostridiales bacterium]|nr:type II toxin-antitoxin system VapC family toxin [Clostridiales bacterium]